MLLNTTTHWFLLQHNATWCLLQRTATHHAAYCNSLIFTAPQRNTLIYWQAQMQVHSCLAVWYISGSTCACDFSCSTPQHTLVLQHTATHYCTCAYQYTANTLMCLHLRLPIVAQVHECLVGAGTWVFPNVPLRTNVSAPAPALLGVMASVLLAAHAQCHRWMSHVMTHMINMILTCMIHVWLITSSYWSKETPPPGGVSLLSGSLIKSRV